jgi:hypothetical protein
MAQEPILTPPTAPSSPTKPTEPREESAPRRVTWAEMLKWPPGSIKSIKLRPRK